MTSVFEHDATPTWSGFIYQGLVAIYLAVSKICELLSQNGLDKKVIGSIYQLEVENWEDVAILRKDGNEKCYISIHQVKNRKEKRIIDYKNPIIQLMLEKNYLKKHNWGTPDAYIHTSSIIEENENEINQLLRVWKDNVVNFYNKLGEFVDITIDNNDKAGFQNKVNEEIENEPIGLKRAKYKELLGNIKKSIEANCTVEKLKEDIKKLYKYLDEELAVDGIDENIKLYQYYKNETSYDVEKLFSIIVEQVKRYKKITKSQEQLIDEQYEYIADKLLNFMRKFILERHKLMQENRKYQKQFSFQNIFLLLDESISDYEIKTNIMALRRHYDEALAQYCRTICKNECDVKEDSRCKLLNLEYSKTNLNEEDFKRMCFGYNPNCDKKIEDRSCLSELLKKEGLHGSVFEVLRKVSDEYFIRENDRTRVVVNDQQNNAFLTAIAHSNVDVVVESIIGGLDKNSEMVSPIFEADELITEQLHSDDGTIWDSDYSEIDDKYISREAVNGSDDCQHSICKPKKPRFITAREMIERLI